MRAGQLRERIEIQRDDGTPDGLAAHVPDWTTIARVYARVETLSGRELVEAQQLKQDVTHRVTIRYLSGLTGKHRVLRASDSILNIEAVIPDERNTRQQLMCRQVT